MSYSTDVHGVELFRWQPHMYEALPHFQPTNFGDELSVAVVKAMIGAHRPTQRPNRGNRLLAIGSILHFAQDFDTVWGTGVNGKVASPIGSSLLDVRAVRGPLTRQMLLERGITCPPIYGDPGLLLPLLYPETLRWAQKKTSPLAILPNINDSYLHSARSEFVNPGGPLREVIRQIAQSEFVVSSSLHGIILAEALGVPVRPLRPTNESNFKYTDYAQGTGRNELEFAESVEEAVLLGPTPRISPDLEPLRASFPYDLWKQYRHSLFVAETDDLESLLRSMRQAQQSLTLADEVLVGSHTIPEAEFEKLSASGKHGATVRVIPARGRTSGDRMNAAFRWSRGRTFSVASEGTQKPPGVFTHMIDSLSGSRASTLFGQAQIYGHGPDEYTRGSLQKAELAHRDADPNDILGTLVADALILDRDHAAALAGPFGQSDYDPIFGLALSVIESQDYAVTSRVVAIQKRVARNFDLATELNHFAHVALHATALKDQQAVALHIIQRGLSGVWSAPISSNGIAIAKASKRLKTVLASIINEQPEYGAIGLLELAAQGQLDVARAGILNEAPHLEDLVRATELVCRLPESASKHDAAKALFALIPRAGTRGFAGEFERLRAATGKLRSDFVNTPSLNPVLAARLSDPLPFACLCAGSTDVIVESVRWSARGVELRGSLTASLGAGRAYLWRRDPQTGATSRLPALDLTAIRSGTEHEFSVRIPWPGVRPGLLYLSDALGHALAPISTVRKPPLGLKAQMARPLELPLDGGQALFIRRPSPLSVLLARLRQKA